MARFLAVKKTGMYAIHFDALDGDIENLAFADPVPEQYKFPSGEILRPQRIFGGGAPVSPDKLPTRMRVSGRKGQLRDFNNAYHMYLASERFVEVVRGFQDAIQCCPVDLTRKDGTPAGRRCFLFTTVLLDAVVRERTTATWTPTRSGKGLWQPQLHLGETFTFDKSRLGGAHMWVDPNMPTKGALVSDALFAALREAKLESFQDSPHFEEV